MNLSFFGQEIFIASGTSFNMSDNTGLVLSEGTDFKNNSSDVILNGDVKFAGSSEQEINGSSAIQFKKLYVDNVGLLLNNNVSVTDELNMQNGIIDLQSSTLTLEDGSVLNGSFDNACMFVSNTSGNLIRGISSNGTYLFPVGDITGSNDYTPASIEMTSGTYSNASLAVNVQNSKHPNNSSTNDYLNRYWKLSASGITNPEYDVTLDFVAGDIAGNDANIYAGYYIPSQWYVLNLVSGNQINESALNQFGDFSGGEYSVFTGINEIFNDDIKIIGLEDGFKIISESDVKVIKVDVINTIGQEVYNQKNLPSNTIKLNNSVKTGIYLIRLLTNKGFVSKKVFIR